MINGSKMENSLDYLSDVLDEVALEGLDGITLSSLWIRLQNRPHFSIPIDEDSKIFLWECLVIHDEIEIYQLPEPRPTIILCNRWEFPDTKLGITMESSEKLSGIYPLCIIDEKGIKGSCETYHTRKCLTSKIRQGHDLVVSLQSALDRWGDKLVLVASQHARNYSLMGNEINHLIEISISTYCLLERIGRSRFYGEIVQIDSKLHSLNEHFPKNLRWCLKNLTRKGIIIKQLHYLKHSSGNLVSAYLLHLNRFYVGRYPKMQSMAKCLCEKLKSKPNCCEEDESLRLELGMKKTSFEKLLQELLHNYIKVLLIPYDEIYPQAMRKQYLKSSRREHFVKVLQLIHPYQEIDKCRCDENNCSVSSNSYFDLQKVVFDQPILSQVYKIIERTGLEGISTEEIGRRLTLPKLQVKQTCKKLESKEIVIEIILDKCQQNVTTYISKTVLDKSKVYLKLIRQQTETKKISNEKNQEPKSFSFKHSTYNASESEMCSNLSSKCNSRNINSKSLKVIKVYNTRSKIVKTNSEKDLYCENKKCSSNFENIDFGKCYSYVNDRLLQEANIIIESVKCLKAVQFTEIQKLLMEKRKEKAFPLKLNKKNLLELLEKLAQEKFVKSVNIYFKVGSCTKNLHYICHPSISSDDPLIKCLSNEEIFKVLSKNKRSSSERKQSDDDRLKSFFTLEGNRCGLKQSRKVSLKSRKGQYLEYMPSTSKIYGFHPKFTYSKIMHLFLFYLIYNSERISNGQVNMHRKSKSWKRFIPILPEYSNIGKGWCLIADLILLMPLSIFVKIIGLKYKIKSLNEYLENSEKQHYLLKYLPQQLINSLVYANRHIYNLYDVITSLSLMGLLSFGPQHKENDQVFIYLHKNAKIINTSVSPPGYLYINDNLHYDVKCYFFATLHDVESYWKNLETMCHRTPSKDHGFSHNPNTAVVGLQHNPQVFEAAMNRDFENVVDDGNIPGDGLGAGGLDSALFSHCKQNWSWTHVSSKWNFALSRGFQRNIFTEENCMQSSLSSAVNSMKAYNIKTLLSKRRQRSAIGNRKPYKKYQPYYDDKDKLALSKMSRMRAAWTAQEDSFLLLCKVASSFLDPKRRRLVVPFTAIRDLIHERFPDVSSNKTSLACQRRMHYMLLNPSTSYNVAVILDEAKQDIDLIQKFDKPKPRKSQVLEWMEIFRSVLNVLFTKFTTSPSDRCKKVVLPGNLEDLYDHYELKTAGTLSQRCDHKDPGNVADICASVVYALIVSTLSITADKINWSYTLIKLCQQYPDILFHSVITQLCDEQVIKKKRDLNIQIPPSSSLPYCFSRTYKHKLQAHCSPAIFEKAHLFLTKLCECPATAVELYGEIQSGECAAVLSLITTQKLTYEVKVPDQIVLFDSSLSEEECFRIAERMKQVYSLPDEIFDELTSLLTCGNRKLTLKDERKRCGYETQAKRQRLSESGENSQSNTFGGHGNLSDAEETYHRYYDIFNINRFSSSETSRFTLYMLRQEFMQPPVERSKHSHYFVINSCRISCTLSDVIEPKYITCKCCAPYDRSAVKSVRNKLFLERDIINKIITSQNFCIPSTVFSEGIKNIKSVFVSYTLATQMEGLNIFNCIHQEKVLGILHSDLWKKFGKLTGDLSLYEHLTLLRKEMIVIRVGVICFRYVSAEFCKPWILASYIIPNKWETYASTYLECESIIDERIKVRFNEESNIKTTSDFGIHNNTDDSAQNRDIASALTKGAIDFVSESKIVFDDENINIVEDVKNSERNINPIENKILKTATSEVKPQDLHSQKCSSAENKLNVQGNQSRTSYKPETENRLSAEVNYSDLNKPWERIYFLSRTWRKPDGSVNGPMLMKFLISVLSYLFSNQAATDHQICEHFSFVLQPIQTLEILELLETARCIRKFYSRCLGKPTLFSESRMVCIVNNPEPDDFVHYETTIDAILNLGQLSGSLTEKNH